MRDNPRSPERKKESALVEFILEWGQRDHGMHRDDFDEHFIKQLEGLTVSADWMNLMGAHREDIEKWSELKNIFEVSDKSTRARNDQIFMRTIGLTAELVGHDILTTPQFEKNVLRLFDPDESCTTGEHFLANMLRATYGENGSKSYQQWLEAGMNEVQLKYPMASEEALQRIEKIQNDVTLKDDFQKAARAAFVALKLSPKWRVFPVLYTQVEATFGRSRRVFAPVVRTTAADIVHAIRRQEWGEGATNLTPEEISKLVGKHVHTMLAETFPEFILMQPRKSMFPATR